MGTKESNQKEFEMPKRTFTVEFIVGLFGIVGVLCFAYLAVNIGSIKLSSAGYYQIYAEFDNISGLKIGAPVEIAGVSVGEVVAVDLKNTSALVTFEIEDNVKLREDDIASIRTKGIIGDRYVKIIPGGADDKIPVGGTMTDTESVVDLEEVIGKFIHKME